MLLRKINYKRFLFLLLSWYLLIITTRFFLNRNSGEIIPIRVLNGINDRLMYNRFPHIEFLNQTIDKTSEKAIYLREYNFHYCRLHKTMSTLMQVIGDFSLSDNFNFQWRLIGGSNGAFASI